MLYVLIFAIAILASGVGAICGVGGGIIMKPVLDTLGLFTVPTVNFLSGCTVLAMSLYSVVTGRKDKDAAVSMKVTLPLAIGAVVGGLAGRNLFSVMIQYTAQARVGLVQAIVLIILTAATLLYTIWKEKIHTHHVENRAACVVIGLVLGLLSSFLGIGGGPFNLMALSWFFSMDTKTAAKNSLFIILCSQIATLVNTLVSGLDAIFYPPVLILMIIGGIGGGVIGRAVNKKISSRKVDILFILFMALVILISVRNVVRFLGMI